MKTEFAIFFAQDGTNVEAHQIMKLDRTVDHVLPKRLFLQVWYLQLVIKCRNLANDIYVKYCKGLLFFDILEPNKVTLVSIMNGGPTEKINDKVFVKHTFDRISPTDSRLEEEKNPVVDCCKEKEVPKYCLGFCSIRMGGERSMNMNVGLGKCKEHSDTIEMCETSKTGHRMLRNLKEMPEVINYGQID